MSNRRKNILTALLERRGRLLGMTIGSGLYYKYAEMNQVDLILALSASRFRQMGINSLAGSLPFESANRMVYDYATKEILSQNSQIPIIFGLCAVDPNIVLKDYIQMLRDSGFSGICNMPTVSIMDGRYGIELERAGFSFQKEVNAIAIAHEQGAFTVAMVRDEEQARLMLNAGCDVICIHFGAAKGGVLGAQQELPLKNAEDLAKQIFHVCNQIRPSVIKMFYGGPAKTPATIRYLIEHTEADGFIGGYTFERLLLERNMQNNIIKETFFTSTRSRQVNAQNRETNYVEYLKEYIEAHYAEKISLSGIARDLYVSRPYLSSLIIKELGESFTDYLIGYRMYRASNLLLNTTLSVAEIGVQVGYPDYAHFSKLFSKKMGTSPSHYRKQYQTT